MQHSQNKHWRERVRPESSFFGQMLPYATGVAIGATLTVALLWGTYNAGRTRGYFSAPDSQQQAAQQENYRFKKTTDKPGNFDAIKQNFFVPNKFSYPTFSERKIVSGAAKLAEKEREHEEKQKTPDTSGTRAQTAIESALRAGRPNIAAQAAEEQKTIYVEPKCSSDHSGFNRVEATVKKYGLPSGEVLCAFETGISEDQKESVAAIRSEDKGLTFIAKYRQGREEFKEFFSYGSNLERFEIVNFSGDLNRPFIAAVGSQGKQKELIVLTYSGHKAAHGKGIGFDFRDTSNSGVKDLIAVGMPDRTGLVHVYQWHPAANLPAGGMFYSPKAFTMSVTAAKHHLTQAIRYGNVELIRQVQNANNPYAFITALESSVRETMPYVNVNLLFKELFETEPLVFLEKLLSDPTSTTALVLVPAFAERFIHHVRTRNDHMIGYHGGTGYTVTMDGQVYSGYRSKEDARQAIADFERRKQAEANRPTPVYTFKERRDEPGGGSSEKRTTVIGQPKSPAQWETERRVQQDPVASGLNEAYHRAGAAKGDAEKKAGEVTRDAGRALNEAVGNINRALQDEGRRRR